MGFDGLASARVVGTDTVKALPRVAVADGARLTVVAWKPDSV
jgi:hypothetical protein